MEGSLRTLMQKYIYKIIISILIFIFSAGYFISSMKEAAQTNKIETTEMPEASFPTVSMLRSDIEINPLHGYSQELQSFATREEITPLENNRDIKFIINPYSNIINRIEYEVKDKSDGIIVSTGETEELKTDETGRQLVTIRLDTKLAFDSEYAFKLRLVNDAGRKFTFFTTIKFIRGDKFIENYNFMSKFFKATLSKTDENAIKPYLETDNSMSNISFAHVNIHSSYDLVTWGNIELKTLTKPQLTVTENTANITAFVCKYIGGTLTPSQNRYLVKEYYRIIRIEDITYLLAFDRRVEEIYNSEKTSLAKSQLKFGITSNEDTDFMVNKTSNSISFVRNRELFYYDMKKNIVRKIFSFSGKDFLDERDYLDQHEIKILRTEENGDIYFIVYGYMNKGFYEGKTGIILYKYFYGEDRIEEQAYIPVNLSASLFEKKSSFFSYVSAEQIFYFSIYDNIYSYSLVKKSLSLLAEGVSGTSYIALPESHSIAWQEKSDITASKTLTVLNLETRERIKIKTDKKQVIALLGKISDNFIYGIANKKDFIYSKSGNVTVLYKNIIISNISGKTLKKYSVKNVFVRDLKVTNNTIELFRVKRKNKKLLKIRNDQILNNIKEKKKEVMIVDRRTDKYLTEYYLTLPYGLKIDELPKLTLDTTNTVITVNRSVKVEDNKKHTKKYFANVSGEFVASSPTPSEMIRFAYKGLGYVVDESGNLVWERGFSRISAKADDVDLDYLYEEDDSIHSAIRLFLTAKGVYISSEELNKKTSAFEILEKQSDIRAINLTGVDLENVLYYINLGSPVIAMKDTDTAVLITAYSIQNIEIMDAKTGDKSEITRKDASKMFETAGNVFMSSAT